MADEPAEEIPQENVSGNVVAEEASPRRGSFERGRRALVEGGRVHADRRSSQLSAGSMTMQIFAALPAKVLVHHAKHVHHKHKKRSSLVPKTPHHHHSEGHSNSVLLPRGFKGEQGEVRERISEKRIHMMLTVMDTSRRSSRACSKIKPPHGQGVEQEHEGAVDEEDGESTSSVSESSESSDDETIPHNFGVFIDFVKRKGGGVGKFFGFLENRPPGPFVDYCKDAFKREEFFSVVWEDIVEFYKNAEVTIKGKKIVGIWPKTCVQTLCDRVVSLIKHKREVNAMRTEIHNWFIRYKLLNTVVAEPGETERERNNRMKEFWGQYHDLARLNELPPLASIASKFGRRLPALKPPARKHAEPKALCFDPEGQWREIRNLEQQEKAKSRAGTPQEDHVRRSMRFTPGSVRSMKWEVTSPAEGTRAAMIRQRATGNDLALERIWNSGICSGLTKSQSSPCLQSTPREAAAEVTHQTAVTPRSAQLAPLAHKSPQLELSDGPTDRYVLACQRCLITPTALPFVSGHSTKLLAKGKNMTDNDLRGIAAMIRDVRRLEQVDVGSNALLTENAIVPFLERLFGAPGASTLLTLTLSECKHMSTASFDTIARLLSAGDGLLNLKTLDISRVKITPRCHLKLASAIRQHDNLEAVHLADTCLGGNRAVAKQCVGHLLSSRSLHTLDIGWNSLDGEVFQELGNALSRNKHVRRLSIPNCSAACVDVNFPAPIGFFLEFLASDTSITQLDLSLNRLDFRSMLIAEDCLEKHAQLHKLDISYNPLGSLGVRSVLRLLSYAGSGLMQFDITGSYGGSEMGAQTFNMTNCGGRYDLDLKRPYHRSILRMLYKTCERMKQSPDSMFYSVQYSLPGWVHASKNSAGIYEVPRDGNLNFVINIETAITKFVKDVQDYNYDGFVNAHASFSKMRPGFKKLLPLLACWGLLEGKAIEQRVFMCALAKDFLLSAPQLEVFVGSCMSDKSDTIERLLPCVEGGPASLSLCVLLFPSMGEFLTKYKSMRTFLDFNIQNPSGHHKLWLEDCSHYAVAEKLLLLDRWEAVLDRKLKRQDTSQNGSGSHIRNEHYRGNRMSVPIAELTLPEIDVLEFDYISGKRCAPDAVVIGERTFANIMISLFDAGCSDPSKLEVLRMLSHHLCLRSAQMRTLLGSFSGESHRAEAFVVFYLQIADMWNAKLFLVRFSSQEEVDKLRERVGFAIFFPYMQPENARFSLRLDVPDQRLCLTMLIQLGFKESAIMCGNVMDPEWVHTDGTIDPLGTGISASWGDPKYAPSEGTFSCSYNCSPENRKFSVRATLAETYGAFNMGVSEDDVKWWTGLMEPPHDVLVFLEFLMGTCKNVYQAFTKIDGPGGNGEISLKEFREGVVSLECMKFKSPEDKDGKEEQRRLEKVFRYMDPGGEGSVSKAEWSVLEQLWNEFDLCTSEFVHFVCRLFGDLTTAWGFLDDDGSGELDLEEWMDSVTKIGYFGPAACIFGILDHSGDGNISFDEFAVLEDFVEVQK